MNKNECKQILEFIAAVDNRELTIAKLDAWFEVIGWLAFDVARQAVVLARQDSSIGWLEPKHVLAKAARVSEMADTEARRERSLREEQTPRQLTDPPKCAHDKNVVMCRPCTTWLWRNHKANHPGADIGDRACFELVTRRQIPAEWEATGAFANPKR